MLVRQKIKEIVENIDKFEFSYETAEDGFMTAKYKRIFIQGSYPYPSEIINYCILRIKNKRIVLTKEETRIILCSFVDMYRACPKLDKKQNKLLNSISFKEEGE